MPMQPLVLYCVLVPSKYMHTKKEYFKVSPSRKHKKETFYGPAVDVFIADLVLGVRASHFQPFEAHCIIIRSIWELH